MRIFNKLLSLLLAVAMLAAVAVFSANAEGVSQYGFYGKDRNYGYGEWPQTVEYDGTGWMHFISGSKITHQTQTYYHCLGQNIADFNELFKKANDEANGVICIDMTAVKASCTDLGVDASPEYVVDTAAAQYNVAIWAGEDLEPVSHVMTWVTPGTTSTLKIDVTDFEGLDVKGIKIGAMNYSCNSNQKGESGCFNVEGYFSPFYLRGSTPSEKGATFTAFDVSSYEEDASTENSGPGGMADLKRDVNGNLIAKGGTTVTTVTTATTVSTSGSGEILYGDTNKDGKVNGKDSMSLKMYNAGNIPAVFDAAAADVNLDTKVNGKDSMVLKKFNAYIIPTLPWTE